LPPRGPAWSCAAACYINHQVVIVPSVVLSFPGSGHTFVSCPHRAQRYLRNSLLPKSGCPNRAFSSNVETAGRASLMFALSGDQANRILPALAGSLTQDAHDQVVHSAQQPRNQHIRRLPLFRSLQHLLPAHAIYDTGTLEPIQCDIGNAISCVITFETCCSL